MGFLKLIVQFLFLCVLSCRGGARRVGARRVGPREGWGPEGWGFEQQQQRRVGAQNFALFFPCPAAKFVLFSLSGGLLVEFWWCLKRRGAQMCTFGVLGAVVCEPRRPGLVGPPGFHTTAREPKRAHLSAPVSKNTTKIQREDTHRGKKRTNFAAGEGKKRAKFWEVQGKGGPGKGGPGGNKHDQQQQQLDNGQQREGRFQQQHHNNHNKTTNHNKHNTTTHHKHTTNTHNTHKRTHKHTHKHTNTQTQVEVGLAKVCFGQSRFWPKSAIPLKH